MTKHSGRMLTTGKNLGEGYTWCFILSYIFSKSIKLFQNEFFKKYFK